MCGVVGVFDRTGRVDPGGLERAVGALHHRGPDGHTVWVDDTGLVGLGHSRLSVIDLHTGRQPVGSEDGRVRAVVNGEFYGYEALRRQLEECGHVFRTQSDSEILVHLYEEYGFSLSLIHI